jgi:hypothetical protein
LREVNRIYTILEGDKIDFFFELEAAAGGEPSTGRKATLSLERRRHCLLPGPGLIDGSEEP